MTTTQLDTIAKILRQSVPNVKAIEIDANETHFIPHYTICFFFNSEIFCSYSEI